MLDVSTEVSCAHPPAPMPIRSYCVEYPNKLDSGPNYGQERLDEVEVRVKHPAPTFFGRIFSVFRVESTRRAVAQQWEIPGTMAIYTNNQDCDPDESLHFNGSSMFIQGWVHSEGGLNTDIAKVPFPNLTASDGSMALDIPSPPGTGVTRCQEDLQPDDTPGVADFKPGSDYLPEGVPPIDWPVWYMPESFGFYTAPTGQPESSPPASETQCRFKGEDIVIENDKVKVSGGSFDGEYPYSGNVIPTGIYCATKTFNIATSQRRTGSITALSLKIEVSAAANTFGYTAAGLPAPVTAYTGAIDPVLFFTVPNVTPSTGDDGPEDVFIKSSHCKDFSHSLKYPGEEMQLKSNRMRWDGVLFNPCGRVLINADNTFGRGAIVADRVKVNGGGFNFVADNDFSGTQELGLRE
jgi:hypothetical protein